MENLTGRRIDRYEILELLGRGGMAMVYKAYDTRLEREVAIKIIRRDAFPPENFQDVLKRFEREAKSLARLSHPNIVKVLDYGEYEDSPFLVLEYFPGGTLKQKIGEPTSWQESARLILPIARGIEYAHLRGVIHRDVKPANILLTENGEPTLSDFGIAKLFQDENATTLTGSGVAIGTPEYMAPEQWTGQTSPKSDMYSLGIIFYEMVTGRRPYIADTPGGVFLKQITEPLPFPRTLVPNLPEEVERILFKALDKEPANRYSDLGAFVRELERLLGNDAVQSRPVSAGDVDIVKDTKTEPEQRLTGQSESRALPEVSIPAKSVFHIPSRLWWGGLVIVGTVVAVALIIGSAPVQRMLNPVSDPVVTATASKIQVLAIPSATLSATVTADVPEPAPATATAASSTSEITDDHGVQMLFVPAGEFTMGCDPSTCPVPLATGGDTSEIFFKNQKPVHQVYLDSYYMDKYEVTNALYKECVKAGICATPQRTNKFDDPLYANHPVIFVDWKMANTFCEWRGAKLPTEAQWEKAARGTDGRSYPWGEDSDCTKANYCKGSTGQTMEVGSFESGTSPYGLYDMAGNAHEWVADWYLETYYRASPSSNPLGPESGSYHVLRGGGYDSGHNSVRTTYRYIQTDFRLSGFRCASDAAQ